LSALDSLIDVFVPTRYQRMGVEAFDDMLAVADLARAVRPFKFCNKGGATLRDEVEGFSHGLLLRYDVTFFVFCYLFDCIL